MTPAEKSQLRRLRKLAAIHANTDGADRCWELGRAASAMLGPWADSPYDDFSDWLRWKGVQRSVIAAELAEAYD